MATRLHLLILLMAALPQAASASPLFENAEVIEAELSGPLHTLFKRKHEEERQEYPFTLTANGVQHDIKVRIRGKSRVSLCTFPPLRLNFGGVGTAGTAFEGQDKLKLVTHCTSSKFSESDLLEEYAAYRIFNLLTDTGYRVRLMRIRYTDSAGRLRGLSDPKYAFLIEAKSELAARNGGALAERPVAIRTDLDTAQAGLVFVYQYLIGNTDWSLARAEEEEFCCHNVTLLDIDSSLAPVPYDFDMSGLVDARYANPHPDLRRIDKVTQRLYRGYCVDSAVVRHAVRQIADSREDIRQLIDGLPQLSRGQKNRKLKFLERFFDEAKKEDKMVERFDDACLGR